MSVKIATLLYAVVTGDLVTAHLVSSVNGIARVCKKVREEKRVREHITESTIDEAAVKDWVDETLKNSGFKNSKRDEA